MYSTMELKITGDLPIGESKQKKNLAVAEGTIFEKYRFFGFWYEKSSAGTDYRRTISRYQRTMARTNGLRGFRTVRGRSLSRHGVTNKFLYVPFAQKNITVAVDRILRIPELFCASNYSPLAADYSPLTSGL